MASPAMFTLILGSCILGTLGEHCVIHSKRDLTCRRLNDAYVYLPSGLSVCLCPATHPFVPPASHSLACIVTNPNPYSLSVIPTFYLCSQPITYTKLLQFSHLKRFNVQISSRLYHKELRDRPTPTFQPDQSPLLVPSSRSHQYKSQPFHRLIRLLPPINRHLSQQLTRHSDQKWQP
jgi:hypothetical protein